MNFEFWHKIGFFFRSNHFLGPILIGFKIQDSAIRQNHALFTFYIFVQSILQEQPLHLPHFNWLPDCALKSFVGRLLDNIVGWCWVVPVGSSSGQPYWVVALGGSSGYQYWAVVAGSTSGQQYWVLVLGSTSGYQQWVVILGSTSGYQHWVVILGSSSAWVLHRQILHDYLLHSNTVDCSAKPEMMNSIGCH